MSAGTATWPFAWSNDAATCVSAPAGLVRVTGTSFSVWSEAGDIDDAGFFGAFAGKLGGGHYGASAGWARSASGPDTLSTSLGAAATLRGDPVGFMEGVFGPSISAGSSLGLTVSEDGSGSSSMMLSADLGLQFSIFPTVAVGASVSGIRLSGEELRSRGVGYGITSIIDRRFRGHFTVLGGDAALGFELGVRDWLTVRSGSNGSSWNAGASLAVEMLSLDWSLELDDSDCRQALGLTVSFGGEN